jgi:orotidine-5'-phosphate decarboxylase
MVAITHKGTMNVTSGHDLQKGDIRRITAALVRGPRQLEGGLISSSRATLFPAAAATGSFGAWKSAFREQLDRQVEDIAENLSNPKPAAA